MRRMRKNNPDNENSNVQLTDHQTHNIRLNDEEMNLPHLENEGGEDEENNPENEEIKSDNNPKPNTTVKISLSARVKRNDIKDQPDSPLPVIKINNTNGKADQEGTDEQTPRSDENSENNKQLKPKRVKKKKVKNNFVNLRAKYDGFNRLRFVYPRIIPRLVEEKDFILP